MYLSFPAAEEKREMWSITEPLQDRDEEISQFLAGSKGLLEKNLLVWCRGSE